MATLKHDESCRLIIIIALMSYKNLDPNEFKELMDRKNCVIIDVRSPQELEEGQVPNHTMINFFEPDFRSKIELLDKTKTYLVYCRSGNRSSQACSLMTSIGFEKVFNLDGGINAWNEKFE